MNFLYPENLWYLLILFPLLLYFYFSYPIRIQKLKLLLGKNFHTGMRKSFFSYYSMVCLLFSLGLSFLIFAFSKPLWGYNRNLATQEKELQLLFVLDISRSMLAKDVIPSRLERAVQLIQELHSRFAGETQGLVVFKGSPRTLIPLTHDTEAFQALFPLISPEILNSPGSNLSRAIQEALKQFQDHSNSSEIIVLLSDGESLSGQLEEVQPSLQSWGGTIISIGVGTHEGSTIYDQNENLILDTTGLPVQSYLQDEILKKLSRETHGMYYWIKKPNLTETIANELSPLYQGDHILSYNLRSHYHDFTILGLLSFLGLILLKRIGFTGIYQYFYQRKKLEEDQEINQNMGPGTRISSPKTDVWTDA